MTRLRNGDAPAFPVDPQAAEDLAGEAIRGVEDQGECMFIYPTVRLAALRGLTKREEIAKAALQGLCANPAVFTSGALDSAMQTLGRAGMATEEVVAAVAVGYADALLAELERKNPGDHE